MGRGGVGGGVGKGIGGGGGGGVGKGVGGGWLRASTKLKTFVTTL